MSIFTKYFFTAHAQALKKYFASCVNQVCGATLKKNPQPDIIKIIKDIVDRSVQFQLLSKRKFFISIL